MPLDRQDSPAKRRTMTVVMWLVLAGTVGLAALVSRYPVDPAAFRMEPEERPGRERGPQRPPFAQPD